MQRKFSLTEKEKEELQIKKQKAQNAKVFKRLLGLELRADGMKCYQIASMLGVCIDTISDWTNLYIYGGIEALCDLKYDGRRISKLEKYKEDIRAYAKNENVSTIGQMQGYLLDQYKVEVENSWLFRFCKKNSIFPTKKQD
jgi:transposase